MMITLDRFTICLRICCTCEFHIVRGCCTSLSALNFNVGLGRIGLVHLVFKLLFLILNDDMSYVCHGHFIITNTWWYLVPDPSSRT